MRLTIPQRLLQRLDDLGGVVARRGDAIALLGVGSVGLDLDRLDEHSDLDFFVIVDRYASAYRSLHAAVGTHYSPRTAAALARVLPPNVIALRPPATLDGKPVPSVEERVAFEDAHSGDFSFRGNRNFHSHRAGECLPLRHFRINRRPAE